VALLLVLALGLPPRGAAAEPPPAPGAPPAAPLLADDVVLGVFDLPADPVVDADTIRVAGRPNVRVLGIDAEEVFKDEADRAHAAADFDAYAREKRGGAPTPVKFGTPEGEAARDFARALFAGVSRVRLERDAPGDRDVDTYGRGLAHVVLLRGTEEVLLAEAVIRAGHSPYFVKYGASRRYDARLRAAEREARDAHRGIWGSDGPRHYPDYPERLAWWQARERQVARWRAGPTTPERIALGVPAESRRLAASVGRDVVVFGFLSRTKTDAWPKILYLADEPRRDFAVVVFDEAVWNALDLAAVKRMYVIVRGRVTRYGDRPQIVLESADQVRIDEE
jgi:endonuclease YncB( thermonuclease family)